jgi:hypothetical protein
LAKGKTSRYQVLQDYTDNDYYGICATCKARNIGNSVSECPVCGLYLGPSVDEIDLDWDSVKCSHINYSCRLSSLEFVVGGIGPAIVYENSKEWTLGNSGKPIMRGLISSELLSTHGDEQYCKDLVEKGLVPQLGDVVLSVQDVALLHLDEHEVSIDQTVHISLLYYYPFDLDRCSRIMKPSPTPT